MTTNGQAAKRPPLMTPRQEEFMLRAVPIEDHDPIESGLGFQARLWAQVSLPYRGPGDVHSWERRNGSVTLILWPGPQQAQDGTVTRGARASKAEQPAARSRPQTA